MVYAFRRAMVFLRPIFGGRKRRKAFSTRWKTGKYGIIWKENIRKRLSGVTKIRRIRYYGMLTCKGARSMIG